MAGFCYPIFIYVCFIKVIPMKTMFQTVFMIMSLMGLFSCSQNGWTDAGPDEFQNASLSAGTCLIDVRTAQEYAEGHLLNAVNIDWQKDGFMDAISSKYSKNLQLAVYCRSGRRSAEAAAALSDAGYKVINLKDGYAGWTAEGKPVNTYGVESMMSGGKPVSITLIKHGTLALFYNGVSIHIDPVGGYGKATDYSAEFPKADVVLVTHEHGDHLDKNAITALSSEKTTVIMNGKSHDQTGLGEVISNGQKRNLPGGITLEAVPAYNTTPGREQFHPKGNGNGYVLTFPGDLRIYVAGDTEDVPEMANLKDIDVAFLPVNQPYTMTVDQCVNAARTIRPRILIPYHFSQTDLSGLAGRLPGIDVRLYDMQ